MKAECPSWVNPKNWEVMCRLSEHWKTHEYEGRYPGMFPGEGVINYYERITNEQEIEITIEPPESEWIKAFAWQLTVSVNGEYHAVPFGPGC